MASRNASNVPSLARALGFRLSADRRRLTVFLNARQCDALLADIRASGAIAVVLNEPSTHRTIQLKGADAVVLGLEPGDLAIVAGFADAMVADLARFGYDAGIIRTVLACDAEDVVAVGFTIGAAFLQTPGPKAGERLTGGA